MIDRHITLAAPGFVVAGQHGDRFQEGGFAGAVFAGDDGDGPIETQFEIIAQEWQAERIAGAIGNARRVKPDTPEIWRRHVDGSIAF